MSQEPRPETSTPENEKRDIIDQVDRDSSTGSASNIDLLSYHEHNAGRLILDPEYVHLTRRRFSLGDEPSMLRG